jgi:hypothetical protein
MHSDTSEETLTMPNDESKGAGTTDSPPSSADDWVRGSLDPITATLPVTDDGRRDLLGSPAAEVGYGDDVAAVDDLKDLWPSRGPTNALRLRVPTAILCALAIAAGGFWGGAALQKSHQSSGTSALAALARSFRSGASGASAASGAARGFGTSTAAATGTVTAIQGNTIYVTNAAGNLVKVIVAGTTSITRNAKVAEGALLPGDTVIVDGSTAKSGVVTASSVAATAAGVTASFARGAAG